MDYHIEEPSQAVRRIIVTVTAEEVAQREQEALQALQSEVQLPGFRKGKVPMSVIKRRFPGLVQNEVVEKAALWALEQIEELRSWKLVAVPRIRQHQRQEDGSLQLEFEVEILPPITVDDRYKTQLQLRDLPPVDEHEVDQVIQRTLEEHGTTEPIDEVEDENALVSLEIREVDSQGLPIVGAGGPQQLDTVIAAIEDKDLRDQLIGRRRGEQFLYTVQRSDGQTQTYQLHVKDIQRRTPAALTEEFVQSITNQEIRTPEAFREYVQRLVESEHHSQQRRFLEQQVIDQIVDLYAATIEVPPSLVDSMMQRRLKELRIDPDQLSEKQRQALQESVHRGIIWGLIEPVLIEREGIVVTEEEIEQDVAAIVEQLGLDQRQLTEQLKQQLIDMVVERRQRAKLIDRLIEIATIVPAEAQGEDAETSSEDAVGQTKDENENHA